MNQLLIVLLAVCLVSAHALDDAPTTENILMSQLENIRRQTGDLIESAKTTIRENIETLKKNAEEFVETVRNMTAQQKEKPKA